ncbi:MAG: hypothetical protein O2923_11100 [Verrucomicrobia bacterium]|nr:hypothetical protein [Verrucomicrobiota bacterium]
MALGSPFSGEAGDYSGIKTSSRLYTTPNPGDQGGIRGSITSPEQAIAHVVAISPDEPKTKCYAGRISGKTFHFENMAPGKYDLIVFYRDRFYEGFSLQRRDEENSLTSEDRAKIDKTVGKAVPFFDVKKIHRLEGTSGTAGKCRAVATYLRTENAGTTMVSGFSGDTFSGQLRSVRLLLLEDVGPGWQIALTREVLRLEVLGDDKKGVLPGAFHKKLSRVRVSDRVKDIGAIDLGNP